MHIPASASDMTASDWFLWFGGCCVLLVITVLIWIALDAIGEYVEGELLGDPDPTCERDIAKHWRVGCSVSGWKKP